MNIFFTKHSEERAHERGILKYEVVYAVSCPDKTEKRHTLCYITKNLGRGTIEVCYEKKENYIKIITIYWK